MENVTYRRLRFEEREEISRCLACNMTAGQIATRLSRHRSTITREINKSGITNQYRAVRSDKRAKRNAKTRRRGKRKIKKYKELKRYVEKHLKLKWSPEQIAESIKIEYPKDMTMRISPESIYTYVYVKPKGRLKDELLRSFRREHRRRHKKSSRMATAIRDLEDMTSIDERPAEIENRLIPGHWEGDLIIGKNRQSAVGTLVERKTKLLRIVRLKNRTAKEVKKKFEKTFRKEPKRLRLSLTYDQGKEMADHKQLSKALKIKVYFAHKASPWERGTNENTNGLIRQFFPKGTDFNKVSLKELRYAEKLLNERPRKTLGWMTPEKAYYQSVALKT
jgi:transposase, IS30 family